MADLNTANLRDALALGYLSGDNFLALCNEVDRLRARLAEVEAERKMWRDADRTAECSQCAACSACDGSCGVCPYADQSKHGHQRAGGAAGERPPCFDTYECETRGCYAASVGVVGCYGARFLKDVGA